MLLLQSAITLAYYALVALAALLLVVAFMRSKSWDRELLYLLVLVPFILRLLRLK